MSELRIITALPSEARGFIDTLALRADENAPGLRLYRGLWEGDEVTLLVSGIGKAAAAAAVGYLAGRRPGPAVWLNAGIAGHSHRPLGDVLLAHAVHDRATGQTLHPPLVTKPPCDTSAVTTVDLPESDYGEDSAYDMEASAWLSAARRFVTAELAHSLKVVSDGPETPWQGLNRNRITQLASHVVDPALELWRGLRPLLVELEQAQSAPAGEEALLERWHFTVSDRRALRRELLRHRALCGEEGLPECLWQGVARGRDAVRRLRDFLDRVAISGSPSTEEASQPSSDSMVSSRRSTRPEPAA